MADVPKWEDTDEITPTWEDSEPPKQAAKQSFLGSLQKGAEQGVLAGWADEGAAKIEQGVRSLYGVPKPYEDILKEKREDYRQAEEQNPGAYLGGNLGGSVLSSAVPVGGALKGLSAAQKAKAALGAGVGMSALAGAGSADEGDRLAGAATGVGTDLAFRGGGKLFEKASKYVRPEAIERFRNKKAYKAIAGNNRKAYDVSDETKDLVASKSFEARPELGGKSTMQFGSNAKGIADRSEKVAESVGKEMGDVTRGLDEAGIAAVINLRAKTLAQLEALKRQYNVSSTQEGTKNIIQKEIDKIKETAPEDFSFEQLERIRNAIKYDGSDVLTGARAGKAELRSGLAGSVGKGVEAGRGLLGKGFEDAAKKAERFGDLRKDYKAFKTADTFADETALRESKNRQLSPSSYAAGVATAASDIGKGLSALMTPVVAIAHQVVLDRGNSAAAVAANQVLKAARAIEMNPATPAAKKFGTMLSNAATRGPAALTVTHQLLMKDPEYQRLTEGDE